MIRVRKIDYLILTHAHSDHVGGLTKFLRDKKISIGKMNKFKEDNALMTQAWVMEPKKKVQDVIKELSITDLKIREFYRIKIGE